MTHTQAKALQEVSSSSILDEVQRKLEKGHSLLQVHGWLEKFCSKDLTLAILDCVNCRIRFAHKFENVDKLLLSREACEQASHWRIASWRADMLCRLAGEEKLTEIGSGIGGDTIYLANRFSTLSYEKCSARAVLTRHNVAASISGAHTFQLVVDEANCRTLEGGFLFADPARRADTRISHPEQWSPALSELINCRLDQRFQQVAVKCAPGLKRADVERWTERYRIDFLSVDGQLKEALLILSEEFHQESRAILLASAGGEPLVYQTTNTPPPVAEPKVGHFLHNPDPAILRARALDSLASELKAWTVHPQIGYLVGPTPCPSAAADSFEIAEHFPLNWTTLKKKMLKSGWTDYEYLGRGVPFSQNDVRKKMPQLKRNKKRPFRGSLIVYREENGYRVVMGERTIPVERLC